MKHYVIIVSVVMALAFSGIARAQDAKEKAAAVKASLVASQALLKQYEWIETTTISVKGDEKSQTVNRCYYGEDGKLQKVPVVAPPPAANQRGLRGIIAQKKKEEMTEYMSEAVALMQSYMPPEPAKIQAVQEAGKLSIRPMPGGEQLRLTFAEYIKKKDSLDIDIDAKRNQIVGARVSSFMDSDKEPVTLTVKFSTLNETIVYPAKITLAAEGQKLDIVVENSGYRNTNRR